MAQLSLDFDPGLTERYPTAMDCVRASAYSNRKPLKTLAADMDMSQSELSRKLAENPSDTRHFTVWDLERYVVASGDLTPVYWFVEKFLQGDADRQQRALAELARRLPDIAALVKAAGVAG